MALTPEHRAKISASLKARHAADPDYYAKTVATASQRGKTTTARRKAELEALVAERDALREQVVDLRAEVERLRTCDGR